MATTPAGRLLAWPNTMQHRVSSFGLRDPTRAGHRKILCFFVVDPKQRIPSTATVPPQQASWMVALLLTVPLFYRMHLQQPNSFRAIAAFVANPDELPRPKDAPVPPLSGVPATAFLSSREAKHCRELLMAERGKVAKDGNGQTFERTFSLCEH